MDAFDFAFASAAATAAATTAAVAAVCYSDDDDENTMPWEREDFVPRTGSGKQKSPNTIRNELQKYIDASPETQTAIIERMGVNNNSFRRFMNPKTYKNQWSAVDNGTYWAAARLLEQERHEKKQSAKSNKRKASNVATGVAKKSKSEQKLEAEQLMDRINAVEGVDCTRVYDSCPELVKKIKDFLATDGVTKTAFCRALGNLNQNSLNPFLMGKNQDKCGNITYPRAYAFFEKKRILEGKPKTKKRIKNEAEHPHGFSLETPRQGRWVISSRAFGF